MSDLPRRIAGLVLLVVAVALPLVLEDFWLQLGLFVMATMVGAVGLTLLVGVAGQLSLGHAAFAAFLQRMEACYHEQLRDLVVMSSPDGQRAAAEYMVHGEYVADDIGMPPARGQKYVMQGAAFFAFHDGRIRRVTDCYNVQEWLAQVG